MFKARQAPAAGLSATLRPVASVKSAEVPRGVETDDWFAWLDLVLAEALLLVPLRDRIRRKAPGYVGDRASSRPAAPAILPPSPAWSDYVRESPLLVLDLLCASTD